ncbi:MAG TPA: glycosyltransferase [Verrucomicrobiae bacterium]|nr:glycosyltransferase [Verrucomicrobiae bacterium]
MNYKLKVLYLGFAFPPGLRTLHPGINIAGHGLETQMIRELRAHCEIRSVGVLPVEAPPLPGADPASGVAHDLLLLDKAPELFHWYRSLIQLKRQYHRWCAEGWMPDAVLVYNLSPIYNNFLRWLKKRKPHPKLILLLLDSAQLGQPLSPTRRFRQRFKPMIIPVEEMIGDFDGCIGWSRSAEKYFTPRNIPFFWMPGGVTPHRAALARKKAGDGAGDDPIRFAYFGALAEHAGIKALIQAFQQTSIKASLHICGSGRMAPEIAAAAGRDSRLKFHGLLTQDECLDAAQDWDVLVNPRPATHGNENNFPSKVFEYALCGRAILTTRMAGVEVVLGPEASYLEPQNLVAGLTRELTALSVIPRSELSRRGAMLRERVINHYSWSRQAAAMAAFVGQISVPPAAQAARC